MKSASYKHQIAIVWLCSYSLNFKHPYYRWLSTNENWIPLINQWEIAVMPSFLFHNHCHAHWYARRPRPSNIWKRGLQVQSSTGYSRVSIQSWDRCCSDGASGNLVHRNCDRAGDSSCCSRTRCSGVSRGGSMDPWNPLFWRAAFENTMRKRALAQWYPPLQILVWW